MRKLLFIYTVLITGFIGTAAGATVRVVATIPDFGDIAKSVGGDLVEVTTLVKATQDPHFVDAKPSLVLALNKADLLLIAGMELEGGWLPPLVTGARNRKILTGGAGYLDCSTLIHPMDVRAVDRAQGDIHPGGNPHYWIDPRNGLRIAEGIAAKLSEIDPENAAIYRQRKDAFAVTLRSRMKQWEAALASIKGASVVVYHESWVYFLDWAHLVQAGALEPKPGIPPTPSHVAGLIGRVRNRDVRFVLQESFYPTQLSKLFSQKSGAPLKVLPTMTGGGRHQELCGCHRYNRKGDYPMKAFIHILLTATFMMIATVFVSCAEKGVSGTDALDCGEHGSAHDGHCHCNEGYFFDGYTCVAPAEITDVCEDETSDAGAADTAETEHDHTACVCPTDGECPCDGEISTYDGKEYCAPELHEE